MNLRKSRHNRPYIAGLAIATLLPLIKESGELHLGNGIRPSYLCLSVDGLEVVLTERVLQMPTQESLRSSLDIWAANGRKVFSASWAPLEIGAFHAGEWVDTLIETAIQRGIDLTGSSPP